MSSNASNRAKGHKIEKKVLQYLRQKGLKCVRQNYISPFGEVDLIMQDQTTLVFTEVRFRRQLNYGSPIETIHYLKQQKIIKTAYHFLKRYYTQWPPCRFDVVAVMAASQNSHLQIQWVPNAFQLH